MKTLNIVWQRLVTPAGDTCARCGATGTAVHNAVATLEQALQPLGIRVALELRAIEPDAFRDRPAESNRIWLAGRPLEDWLGAGVGASACCDACGGADCRTLELQGESYEAIPEGLIVQAALSALSSLPEQP